MHSVCLIFILFLGLIILCMFPNEIIGGLFVPQEERIVPQILNIEFNTEDIPASILNLKKIRSSCSNNVSDIVSVPLTLINNVQYAIVSKLQHRLNEEDTNNILQFGVSKINNIDICAQINKSREKKIDARKQQTQQYYKQQQSAAPTFAPIFWKKKQ